MMKSLMALFALLLPMSAFAHPLATTPIDQSGAKEIVFLNTVNILPKVKAVYFNNANLPQDNHNLTRYNSVHGALGNWSDVFCEVRLFNTSDHDRSIRNGKRYRIRKIHRAETVFIRDEIPTVSSNWQFYGSKVKFEVESKEIQEINCYKLDDYVRRQARAATLEEFNNFMSSFMKLALGEPREID